MYRKLTPWHSSFGKGCISNRKGGEKVMEQNMFMGVEEVRSILKISRSAAYKIIRNLNLELEKKGYITIKGRISREYFKEKFYRFGKD
jgi:predicted transcriptional regulator of viral defense system